MVSIKVGRGIWSEDAEGRLGTSSVGWVGAEDVSTAKIASGTWRHIPGYSEGSEGSPVAVGYSEYSGSSVADGRVSVGASGDVAVVGTGESSVAVGVGRGTAEVAEGTGTSIGKPAAAQMPPRTSMVLLWSAGSEHAD